MCHYIKFSFSYFSENFFGKKLWKKLSRILNKRRRTTERESTDKTRSNANAGPQTLTKIWRRSKFLYLSFSLSSSLPSTLFLSFLYFISLSLPSKYIARAAVPWVCERERGVSSIGVIVWFHNPFPNKHRCPEQKEKKGRWWKMLWGVGVGENPHFCCFYIFLISSWGFECETLFLCDWLVCGRCKLFLSLRLSVCLYLFTYFFAG